tara:strand:- start:276 stop:449 length:174 start_codon:yes stop_codon:yes gene_type:complete
MPGPHGKKKKDNMEYKMGGGMMYKKGGKTKKKMKKKGAKGAPTAANFRRAAQTARKK